jgi:hypothetical protein
MLTLEATTFSRVGRMPDYCRPLLKLSYIRGFIEYSENFLTKCISIALSPTTLTKLVEYLDNYELLEVPELLLRLSKNLSLRV